MTGGLVLRGVTLRRGGVTVLRDQDVSVPPGGTLVVTGGNGVGKSTLLQVMAGLVPVDRGAVRIGGVAPDPRRPDALVAHGIWRGCVFQQGGLVSTLTALDNVGLPLRYHADGLGLSGAVIEERSRFCLGAVGVGEPEASTLPGHLSFGVRKRVAFARAMVVEPNFAFFDDPDAGLDRENSEVVHEILLSYRNDPAVTMVVATNHRVLLETLNCPVHELVDGALCLQDLHTMPPSSLI